MSAPTIHWGGESGEKYKYWIMEIGTVSDERGGNYIFAKEVEPEKWAPVYIGQTNNLQERLANHEKEPCAKDKGATHIHCHIQENEESRLAEEADLINRWNPPCNG